MDLEIDALENELLQSARKATQKDGKVVEWQALYHLVVRNDLNFFWNQSLLIFSSLNHLVRKICFYIVVYGG
jgi:hypothetical protein